MKLTPGMFGSEFNPVKDAPLGLRCGQMRYPEIVHNGGWYNQRGEKIGFGDLSSRDFVRIAEELDPGEAFIILSEGDSFWNFVTNIGMLGSLCATEPTEAAPGVDYVVKHAMQVICGGKQYLPSGGYTDWKPGEVRECHGIAFHIIAREDLPKLLNPEGAE